MMRTCGGAAAGPSSLAAALADSLARAVPEWSCAHPGRRHAQGFATATAQQHQKQQQGEHPPAADGRSGRAPKGLGGSHDGPELRQVFSIRPSFLSPLYHTWRRGEDEQQRRNLLLQLLHAQKYLAKSMSGQDDEQLARAVQARASNIHALAADLRQSRPLGGILPPCTKRSQAIGWFAALEGFTTQDVTAMAFQRMQAGELSPWEHYRRHFVARYEGVPGLQPLDVIYGKPDPDELLRQLQASAAKGQAVAAPGGRAAARAYIDTGGKAHAIGKRKSSHAHVCVAPAAQAPTARPAGSGGEGGLAGSGGSARITVNGVSLESYFPDPAVRALALQPLLLTRTAGHYAIDARLRSGGRSGQAQAMATGVARALCLFQPWLRPALKSLVVWDGRVVERKKPARKKARRGFQWVKR